MFLRRYGIRAPVYLRDKQGLVVQPHPISPDKVVFDSGKAVLLKMKTYSAYNLDRVSLIHLDLQYAGTVIHTEQSITVTYSSGQYSFQMLDHVRVHVTSKVSHAHGYTLSLQLLRCGAIPPPSPSSQAPPASGERKGEEDKKKAKQELIKVRE